MKINNRDNKVSEQVSPIETNYNNIASLSKDITSKTNSQGTMSLKDSTGNTLSYEQAKYFDNSKVRDENGNLLRMFHGTNHFGFTTFKINAPIFLTSNIDVAQSYSGANGETNIDANNNYVDIDNLNPKALAE